jgi:hypothetical protein
MERNIPQQQPQQPPPHPPPPRVFNKATVRYSPLNLLGNIHIFPDNYLKLLPKFDGEDEITSLEHLSSFDHFTDNQGLHHEDVYMRIFGEVRTWFKGLPPNSIYSWDALEYAFLRKWGEMKDHLYLLTEFGSLKKKQNESALDLIQIFNKIYKKILVDVNPSQPATKFTFVGSFDPDFSLLLRERRSITLTGMEYDVVEIESNMIALGKSRVRIDSG